MIFRKMFTFGLVVLLTFSGFILVFNSAEGLNGELDKKDEKIRYRLHLLQLHLPTPRRILRHPGLLPSLHSSMALFFWNA